MQTICENGLTIYNISVIINTELRDKFKTKERRKKDVRHDCFDRNSDRNGCERPITVANDQTE